MKPARFGFVRNGSPTTGTLTVEAPDGGEYTAEINLTSIRSRNAFSEEAGELLGLDPLELKREIIKAANSRMKDLRRSSGKGAAGGAGSRTGGEKKVELSEEAKSAGRELAGRADVMAEFRADLRRSGFAGELDNAEILFLALVSRLFKRPVSVAVKGPSSGGKSFLVESVLGFYPESAYLSSSGYSDHALIHSAESFEHRFLIMAEAAGTSGKDFADYLVRTLQSEGRIEYDTVEKTRERLIPRRVVKEGPTGFITTTTRVKLNPENETRLLSLTVNDSAEQTKTVLLELGREATGGEATQKPDLSRWHAFQELLAGGECRVVIPYGVELAELVPPKAVRLRRDFKAALTLIKAHALLHRESRERDERGRIVATLEDYAAVLRLVGEMMSEGVESATPATVRETVEAAGRLLREATAEDGPGPDVTAKAIAEELGIDKSSASRRARRALDAGYLENREDRKGRPMRLVLGEPIPKDEQILPSVEDLSRHIGDASSVAEKPGCNRATVQPPDKSGVDMPNTAVGRLHAPDATAQPGCTDSEGATGRATAETPTDKGDGDSGCTVARLHAGFCEETQPLPEEPPEMDYEALVEERMAGLETAFDSEPPEPDRTAPDRTAPDRTAPETSGPSTREELISRVRGELEENPRVAEMLKGWVAGRMPAGPLSSTLAYNLYGTATRHEEVLPFVEKLLEEVGR